MCVVVLRVFCLFVCHTNERLHNSVRYNEHRFGPETWENNLFNSVTKLGKSRRVVYRWRHDVHTTWIADAKNRENVQGRFDLHEPILCKQVKPRLLSLPANNCFYGYFDQRPIDQQGRWHLFHRTTAIRRHPSATDTAEIWIATLDESEVPRKIAETTAWNYQQGSFAQFLPEQDHTIIFNDRSADNSHFQSVILDISSGNKKCIPHPIADLSSDGRFGLSLNFSRLLAYRPGYGYADIPDPYAAVNRPQEDGLRVVDLKTGTARLVISLDQLYDQFFAERIEGEEQKIIINHAGFSPNGRQAVMLVRLFSRSPPFPTLTIVVDIETGKAHKIYDFVSHYNWKDETTLLATGINSFVRDNKKPIKTIEIDAVNGEAISINEEFFVGDGHCTYSTDQRFILFDSYSNKEFPYRKLQVYDLEMSKGVTLGYFFSDPDFVNNDADLRCDLHPRWLPDGSGITFDSTHEGFRGVYFISMAEVVSAFQADFPEPIESQLRKEFLKKMKDVQTAKRMERKKRRRREKYAKVRKMIAVKLGWS